MKYIVGIARILVGILFIISGLIKLNDPVGFSFKLEEYFSSGVLDLPIFEPYALAISIIVVILEVVLGVFLLLGFKKKWTLWSLLLMIIFFTFLTFYSAYFNKVTDCGCFGDAIKLTPWESFTKDIILLVLIVLLFLGQKYIRPIFSAGVRKIIVALSVLLCMFYANYVLNHLPQIDFRPYKIGANIEEGMNVPPDAPKAIFEYAWKFNVNGEEKVIVTNGDYPTVDGEFVDVETTEIQKGYEPPIHDFTIEHEGEDLTTAFLSKSNLLVVIAYDLRKTNSEAFKEIKEVTDEALRKHYTVIGLSASDADYAGQMIEAFKLNFAFYFTDETALKTIVRSNPGLLILDKGTVLQKVHFKDIDNLVINNPMDTEIDLDLKKSLDSVMVLDQKYRANPTPDNWKKQMDLDSTNIQYIESLIAERGYPGKSMVGDKTQSVAWYVIQHSNKIPKYIDLIEEAAKANELPFRLYAMMLDRYLMNKKEPQLYGTQGMSYYMGTPDEVSLIWPVKNPDSVNILRQQAGFEDTVEENAKRIFGDDFEFKVYTITEVEKIINRTN